MKWYESSMLKKAFLETTDWNAAWRKRGETAFRPIQNPKGYWLADTLLFEDERGSFLFVEAFDKQKKRGLIGVLPYDGASFSDFRIVISRNYHMSYPYVFTLDRQTYMIPETSANNCIELFRAVDFPDGWECVGELLSGCYADTTVWPSNDGPFPFSGCTYDLANRHLVRFDLDIQRVAIRLVSSERDSDSVMRPGGRPYLKNDELILPFQDNKYLYGQNLRFMSDGGVDEGISLLPQDIATSDGSTFRRLHTYSRTKEFEAIDLSDFRFSAFKAFKKVFG